MTSFTTLALATLTLAAACTSSESTSSATSLSQEPGNCGELETHVFASHRTPDGKATVKIERPGTHAIIVSAFAETQWTVVTAPGAFIEAIYAVGVKEQSVEGPVGVQMVSEAKVNGEPWGCADGYPESSIADCNTKNLLDLVEHRVHEVTSFHACDEASSWVMKTDMTVVTDCKIGQGDMVKGCTGEDACGGPIFL